MSAVYLNMIKATKNINTANMSWFCSNQYKMNIQWILMLLRRLLASNVCWDYSLIALESTWLLQTRSDQKCSPAAISRLELPLPLFQSFIEFKSINTALWWLFFTQEPLSHRWNIIIISMVNILTSNIP